MKVTHDAAVILAKGFKPLGEPQEAMIGHGAIRRHAIREDVTLESVTAFRTQAGWQAYLRPDPVPGFTDQALLP